GDEPPRGQDVRRLLEDVGHEANPLRVEEEALEGALDLLHGGGTRAAHDPRARERIRRADRCDALAADFLVVERCPDHVEWPLLPGPRQVDLERYRTTCVCRDVLVLVPELVRPDRGPEEREGNRSADPRKRELDV